MADGVRARVALLADLSAASAEVFRTVLTRSPISRIEIARLTGLSQAAVTKAVTPLAEAGLVAESAALLKGVPGRPANPVSIVADALVVIGVKVNADELVVVATDLRTTILQSDRTPLPDARPEVVLDAVVEQVQAMQGRLGDYRDRVAGVGVSVSGEVDAPAGVVRRSALMGWSADVDVRGLLQQRLAVPVVVDNDVRALAFAEHSFGRGLGTESFAIVTIGRGIGGGLHVNGDVVEGSFGVAGEIGHLPLAPPDRQCACGRRGCVEAVAATAAIVERVSADHGRAVSIEQAVDLAHAGDRAAVAAFSDAARIIGTAIACLINLVGPQVVIIGGEAVRNFDLFDADLRAAVAEHAFGAAGRCEIVVSPHSFEDWARGAATAVVRSLTRAG